jgi:molybdopterin-guanine dinucleotide biosynthesis protein A
VSGIRDAVRAAGGDVVVCACDLPWLDARTVSHLVAVAGTRPDADVVVACDDSGPHLAGVWRGRSLDRLEAVLAEGVRSYRGALEHMETVCVEVPASVVTNVNSPGDLRRRR